MYQLQGVYWQRWNDALRANLVDRQVKDGPQAGSWDTNDLWGGHGGRVYTTAMATLALEVYYRFLPLYAGVIVGGRSGANRAGKRWRAMPRSREPLGGMADGQYTWPARSFDLHGEVI